jgi:hypothetical protein
LKKGPKYANIRSYLRRFFVLERASGQFIIDGQVEDIFGGTGGAARIARISQSCRFSGQLEGESMAEFTAVLPREGDGSFHGFQRVGGTLGEREGSFVLSVTGEIHKGQPRGSWSIVPKSGSGDFVHIRGGGTFSLPDGKPGKYQLEFDLRKPRAAKSAVAETAEEATVDTVEQVVDAPIAAVDIPVDVPMKPARKPRVKNAEPVIEVVAEAPVKRSRSRKAEPTAPEPVAAIEPPAKRARTRKVEPTTPAPVVTSEKPVKRTRSRKVEPAPPAPTAVEPAAKPKRGRKSATNVPAAEPLAAVAEPVQEQAPAKPARRKKTPPPEPIALPVAEPVSPRKRRAKAA